MATPVTIPDPAPTVAIAVDPLVQVPPVMPSLSAVVPPLAQVVRVPDIAVGAILTTTGATAIQVEGKVYVIFVVPPDKPATTPVAEIDPTAGLLLDHIPVPASLRTVVLPIHTLGVPPMAAGKVLTVTVATAGQIEPGGA